MDQIHSHSINNFQTNKSIKTSGIYVSSSSLINSCTSSVVIPKDVSVWWNHIWDRALTTNKDIKEDAIPRPCTFACHFIMPLSLNCCFPFGEQRIQVIKICAHGFYLLHLYRGHSSNLKWTKSEKKWTEFVSKLCNFLFCSSLFMFLACVFRTNFLKFHLDLGTPCS